MAQMMPQSGRPTVLLTGGTGQVGIFALPRLLAAGFPVIACSRSVGCAGGKQGRPAIRWFHPDEVTGTGRHDGCGKASHELQDVSVLLSCGPVALAGQLAAHCTRLRQVVCISSSSVYTKAQSPDTSERRLIAAIKAAEDELKRYCKAREIALVLLRPTLIYGCGRDRNISRIAHLVRRFHFIPVSGRATGRRQPLHADDLAKLLLSVLEAGGQLDMDCPVGGGSIITYREMVERIFIAFGQTPRILQIPPHALAAMARALSWLPYAQGLNAEMVNRQNRDLIFDDACLRDAFGFNPRPFEPVPGDFSVPAAARLLQPS